MENTQEFVEANLRLCKVCNEKKIRILDGKFDAINKRWVDSTGKCWNGNVCPDCHKNRAKHNMRKLRSDK